VNRFASRRRLRATPNDPAGCNPNPEFAVEAFNGTVDDMVSNLFDDAVSNQGSVKRSKVYGYLAGIVRTLAEKLFSDK
jgi:hypothetical protein